jgi:hypothetical protein
MIHGLCAPLAKDSERRPILLQPFPSSYEGLNNVDYFVDVSACHLFAVSLRATGLHFTLCRSFELIETALMNLKIAPPDPCCTLNEGELNDHFDAIIVVGVFGQNC